MCFSAFSHGKKEYTLHNTFPIFFGDPPSCPCIECSTVKLCSIVVRLENRLGMRGKIVDKLSFSPLPRRLASSMLIALRDSK